MDNTLKRLAREAMLFWGVSLRASKPHPLSEANKRFNHKMSLTYARIKHVFRAVRRQLGDTKVHDRKVN